MPPPSWPLAGSTAIGEFPSLLSAAFLEPYPEGHPSLPTHFCPAHPHPSVHLTVNNQLRHLCRQWELAPQRPFPLQKEELETVGVFISGVDEPEGLWY